MSQDIPLYVPDGYYPPYAVVSETDHGAYIIIAVALGLTFVLISSILRIALRTSVSQRPGLDDAFLAVATVLGIIQGCIILGACSRGLGRSIELLSRSAVASIERSYYASNIFVTTSLALSRCCILIFILRLTPIESHRRIAYGIIIATALWAFGAVFASALQCDPSQPWRVVGQQCDNVATRLKVVCIFDAILEALVVACTAWMVRPLKTSLSNKFVVVFVFSFRLPIIVLIAFRLKAFSHANLTTNFTFAESSYIALTQTQVNYSLISATIPNLRPIINNLNTHYGAMGESTLSGSNYNSNSNSTSHSRKATNTGSGSRTSRRHSSLSNIFPLRFLGSKTRDSAQTAAKGNSSGSREEYDDIELPHLETVPSIGTQAVETGSSVRVHGGLAPVVPLEAEEGRTSGTTRKEDAESVMSNESQRMIIRKAVDIHVQRDHR